MIMDRIALILSILGALNLGSMGIFGYDIIHHALGGAGMTGNSYATAARVLYTLIGLAGLWCISLLFRERESWRTHNSDHH